MDSGFGITALESVGGARRDRTADLVIANDALSQLSYGPLIGRPNGDGGQAGSFTIPIMAKSRTPKINVFGAFGPGTSLVCAAANRY